MLARSAAFAAVLARRRGFGFCGCLATRSAQQSRHPTPSPEHALHEGRHIDIRVQPGPVQAEASRTDLDLSQVVGPGFRQLFQQMHGHHDDNSVAQADDQSVLGGVVFGADGIAVPAYFLAPEDGGHGASLPELFALLIELSQADSNVTNALRAHFGFTEDALCAASDAWRTAWIARIGAGTTIFPFACIGEAPQVTLAVEGLRSLGLDP
mgnify:CR=1 FL=1